MSEKFTVDFSNVPEAQTNSYSLVPEGVYDGVVERVEAVPYDAEDSLGFFLKWVIKITGPSQAGRYVFPVSFLYKTLNEQGKNESLGMLRDNLLKLGFSDVPKTLDFTTEEVEDRTILTHISDLAMNNLPCVVYVDQKGKPHKETGAPQNRTFFNWPKNANKSGGKSAPKQEAQSTPSKPSFGGKRKFA